MNEPTRIERTIRPSGKALGAGDYSVLDPAAADARFGLSARLDRVDMPLEPLTDGHEVRVYEGDLIVDEFDGPSDGGDGSHNVVVDGNLIVKGKLSWTEYAGGSFLVVTGAISAGAIHARGCPVLFASHLEAETVVGCEDGGDGGAIVATTIRAGLVLQTSYFRVEGGTVEGLVIGDPGFVKPRLDVKAREAAKALGDEFIDPETERPSVQAVVAAMLAGREVGRPAS